MFKKFSIIIIYVIVVFFVWFYIFIKKDDDNDTGFNGFNIRITENVYLYCIMLISIILGSLFIRLPILKKRVIIPCFLYTFILSLLYSIIFCVLKMMISENAPIKIRERVLLVI